MHRRMLDTAHLPLFNASGAMLAKFDYLRDAVRGAVVSGSSSQKAEKLLPLLELMEEVDRMRTEGLGTEGNDIGARTHHTGLDVPRVPIPGLSMLSRADCHEDRHPLNPGNA
jgi:hypothetical protein